MISNVPIYEYINDRGILSIETVVIAFAAWSFYLVALGIYRVFLSPLAKFPGPKLAALTTWYQAYYDIWLHGQYFKKIDQLHEAYGPIVRINPHELHVSDPEFIDELYTGPTKKRDKYKWTGRSILLPESTVATMPHELHRKRRAALSPYFSKTSIRRLEPVIQRTLGDLLKRFSACGKTGDVMPMSTAYKATTSDIITGYSFGTSVEYLKKDDYNVPFFEAVAANFEMAWWMTHIPWLGPLMNLIPVPVMGLVMPGLESLWQMHRHWTSQIDEIRASKDLATNNGTIFHGILNSNLPPSEKASGRLRQEAQLVVLAGQDTTAMTLSAITFQVLANPDVFRKLKEELVTAIPDANAIPAIVEVETLPYLSAVIQEGLRLHPGAILRMQRVSPETSLVYSNKSTKKDWTIPAGSAVSMDARTTQLNPTIFPDPTLFKPERWIDNARLDKYLLTFSKGTRMCVGMNLAYAELYLILAGIFRKYDLYDGTGNQESPTLALYNTIRERDVDAVIDLVVPFPAKGSKGVRLAVREGHDP